MILEMEPTSEVFSMKTRLGSDESEEVEVEADNRVEEGAGIIGPSPRTWPPGLRVGTTDALRGPSYSIAFTVVHTATYGGCVFQRRPRDL